ncbi:MAG: hypothetical protein IPH43_09815 [Xanthomonadales bacterium]|uniref:hypothetical protein n=3 Tax=Dokdonella sp. TaxID=2291710 RepID=UPI002CEAB92D|nr:hypothetical protein [Xanthomonadales bacterium]HQV73496.1 hypothetical protein [Dokdonella sp.]MBK7012924.1 hypothetical protein [Xanthomonadales bacterium]MBK7210218.1 hypothetical protein [Xanthomonadales bacterium]MBL0223668.1 hypothetical protein [Xanthomonadales bacterium]
MPLTPILIALYVFAGFCALFALISAAGARRRWRERHRFSACHRSLWTMVFLLLALLGAFSASALLGYRRLTTETLLATLQVRQLGPQRFNVRIDTPDGAHRDVAIAGDQWQLDARVVKWEARAVMFGAPALYRLDRISGRYADATAESERARSVVALDEGNPFDLLDLKRRFPQWLPWIDADYGSAAFLPLVDGGEYNVSLAPAGGLVARPANALTERKLREAGW